jgi:hypothetical protein
MDELEQELVLCQVLVEKFDDLPQTNSDMDIAIGAAEILTGLINRGYQISVKGD